MTTEELTNLRNELRTQDNRATGCPLFIVEVERRIYGMNGRQVDDLDFVWVHEEDHDGHYEPSEVLEVILEEYPQDTGIDPAEYGYEQWFYVTHMEFVCAHLTERAADQYIKANSHNLRKPRVYVTSQHRCHEWNMVREQLMGETPTKFLIVTSGCDWVDAAFDHAIIPSDLDVEAANKEYKSQGGYVDTGLWFVEWLCKHHGATEPSEGELESFHEQ